MKIPVVLLELSYCEQQYSCLDDRGESVCSKIGSDNIKNDETFWYLSEITSQYLGLVSSIGETGFVGEVG